MCPSTASPTRARATARSRERSLRKRENTRARLVEAAADIVASKGIASTRIDDIVKKAGFTRGAFYSNYSSVEEVLREAIVARAEFLAHQLREAVEAIEGPPSVDTLMEVLDAIRPEGRTMYILTTEYRLYRMRSPEAEEIPVARREQFSSLVAGTVQDALARMGRHPRVSPETLADVLAAFFLDSIASESDHACQGADDSDPRVLLRHVVEAVIIGLSEPIQGEPRPEDAQRVTRALNSWSRRARTDEKER